MKIFLGGKTTREEFQAIERDVRRAEARFGVSTVLCETFARGALDDSTARTLNDVGFFLLCRSFPNEFSPVDVERLRRIAPLAPIALVAGSLCEGENRTGATFPGTRRFYAETWRSTGRREFFRFFAESAGLFAASPLATWGDFCVEEARRGAKSGEASSLKTLNSEKTTGAVAIFPGGDAALGRLLRDEFAERGASVRLGAVRRLERFADFAPTRVVVDAVDLAAAGLLDELRAIRAAFPAAALDLLGFAPRRDEVDFWERQAGLGALRVVAKPFDVDFLTGAAF
ncbi:MAG: hypothetical protein IKU86_12445 [Thermoguttaceae bacterium]|nr:hypothetical protein [Thermoguttaceae bacterium]